MKGMPLCATVEQHHISNCSVFNSLWSDTNSNIPAGDVNDWIHLLGMCGVTHLDNMHIELLVPGSSSLIGESSLDMLFLSPTTPLS